MKDGRLPIKPGDWIASGEAHSFHVNHCAEPTAGWSMSYRLSEEPEPTDQTICLLVEGFVVRVAPRRSGQLETWVQCLTPEGVLGWTVMRAHQ